MTFQNPLVLLFFVLVSIGAKKMNGFPPLYSMEAYQCAALRACQPHRLDYGELVRVCVSLWALIFPAPSG